METPRPAPANPGVRLAGRTTGRTGSMTDDPPGKRKGARANREGKPWQRADGRWTVRVWPPAGGDRKPRYVYGRTRAEVARKREEVKAELAMGLPEDKDQTIGAYMTIWLTETLQQYVTAGQMAQSTLDSYRDNARKHIIPVTGPSLAHIRLRELTAPRICFRYCKDPWKNFSSVSTDRQLAPAASYSRAIRTGSKSGRITPADGEAFLTSAIRATEPLFGFRNAPVKSRCPPQASIAAFKSATEKERCGSRATSRFFSSTMVSRIVLLLFISNALHPFERTAGAQPGVDEWVQIAVHDRRHVAGFDARAQVFHHAIRLEEIAANLVAPGDAAFVPVEPLHCRFLRVHALGVDAREQELHRRGAILVLGPLALRGHDQARRNVRDANGGFDLVHVLATLAA